MTRDMSDLSPVTYVVNPDTSGRARLCAKVHPNRFVARLPAVTIF